MTTNHTERRHAFIQAHPMVRVYRTSRYCPECQDKTDVTVAYHPNANVVWMHCTSCNQTHAFRRIYL